MPLTHNYAVSTQGFICCLAYKDLTCAAGKRVGVYGRRELRLLLAMYVKGTGVGAQAPTPVCTQYRCSWVTKQASVDTMTYKNIVIGIDRCACGTGPSQSARVQCDKLLSG